MCMEDLVLPCTHHAPSGSVPLQYVPIHIRACATIVHALGFCGAAQALPPLGQLVPQKALVLQVAGPAPPSAPQLQVPPLGLAVARGLREAAREAARGVREVAGVAPSP
jgi:hypothetical protein